VDFIREYKKESQKTPANKNLPRLQPSVPVAAKMG